MQTPSIDPTQASARMTEEGARFDRTLFAALDALEEAQIPHALIGGVAASGMGRPRSTHDVDFFVRPEDADAVLEALARSGFTTEKTDFRWLFKAWREEILVDIIFKSHGDIYYDDEMHQRARQVAYHGRNVRTVSPEDLIIIKCAVSNEGGPHHWHDALSLLSHASLDWDYLVQRARRASRRVLALLVYAQSADILVPNEAVLKLFRAIYGEDILRLFLNRGDHGALASDRAASASDRAHLSNPSAERRDEGGALLTSARAITSAVTAKFTSSATSLKPSNMSVPVGDDVPADEYVAGRIKDALTQDERTSANDVKIFVSHRRVTISGESRSDNHREMVQRVVRDVAPGFEIDNQLRISVLTGPQGAEEIA